MTSTNKPLPEETLPMDAAAQETGTPAADAVTEDLPAAAQLQGALENEEDAAPAHADATADDGDATAAQPADDVAAAPDKKPGMAAGDVMAAVGAWASRTAAAAGRGIALAARRFGAFMKKHWPQIFRPMTVLVCICLGVGLCLALTNYFTAPVIQAGAAARADAARQALLPADSYETVPGAWDNVTEAVRAIQDGKTVGYIIVGTARGYGGAVPATVAFDADGTILGVLIEGTDETQGQGARVEEPAFLAQFAGLAAQPLAAQGGVTAIAGATISSRAAGNAVDAAIAAYQSIVEGGQ